MIREIQFKDKDKLTTKAERILRDKNKKILIATTFRNFNGSENDKIQRMFLNSLVNQSYKNFK